MLKKIGLITTLAVMSTPAMADTYMDASWAKKACAAWNASPVLTKQLASTEADDGEEGYAWAKNNAGRGYKLVQMYRTSCGANSKVQLTIQEKDGKAMCVSAGKPDGKAMNFKVDYLMHASDKNWACMGKGSFGCGAMGAMMSGKLKFQGPKMEAMKVMGPFESFLKVAGKTAGDKSSCPK
ncbi:MAG: SCP2 sterol-binding domain-containing protein [Thiotrichaceae bacterium]